jgi:DNA-binding LacI/PurR family transcriptional regulator
LTHITQLDIAKKLKVTRITVSKALRGHPDISKEMKKKVLDAAEKLGYIPNLVAQNLSSRKTFTIGLVIPDLENSFFALAADSIIDSAGEKNYNVLVTVSRENQQSEKLNIQKLIGMRVDGLLICISQQTKDPQIFNHIKKLNIPLVFFDRQFRGLKFPGVTFEDKNGAVKALNKIFEQGYTKIAHFAGYSNVSIGTERCTGYKDALKKKGIKIKPEWIIEGGFEIIDGYNAFIKLYNSQNLPEIILTVNDRVALGVYKAAAEKGLKIPEDIGIAGFGFQETAQSFTPSLSVINQDPRRIGNSAAELLIEMINNPVFKIERNIIIEEEFIWNNSILKK